MAQIEQLGREFYRPNPSVAPRPSAPDFSPNADAGQIDVPSSPHTPQNDGLPCAACGSGYKSQAHARAKPGEPEQVMGIYEAHGSPFMAAAARQARGTRKDSLPTSRENAASGCEVQPLTAGCWGNASPLPSQSSGDGFTGHREVSKGTSAEASAADKSVEYSPEHFPSPTYGSGGVDSDTQLASCQGYPATISEMETDGGRRSTETILVENKPSGSQPELRSLGPQGMYDPSTAKPGNYSSRCNSDPLASLVHSGNTITFLEEIVAEAERKAEA